MKYEIFHIGNVTIMNFIIVYKKTEKIHPNIYDFVRKYL